MRCTSQLVFTEGLNCECGCALAALADLAEHSARLRQAGAGQMIGARRPRVAHGRRLFHFDFAFLLGLIVSCSLNPL